MSRDNFLDTLATHQTPGVLCTSDGKGEVNAAIFGSVRLLDKQTIVIGLGDNRTCENLLKNPKATYVFFEPGPNMLTWRGARLYLEATKFENSGELLEQIIAETEAVAGKMAASMLKTVVHFNITDVRPLIDLSR